MHLPWCKHAATQMRPLVVVGKYALAGLPCRIFNIFQLIGIIRIHL